MWWLQVLCTGRMNNGIGRFHGEADDIVPLAVRQISHDESDIDPHEDVTWWKVIWHKI